MALSPKYEKQMRSLYEKYRREVELLEAQISQARDDKTYLLDLMINFSLESGVEESEFVKQKRQSRLRHAKPEYRGYSFETAVIAILDGQTKGMTITEIAKEMALPESEAINSIYKSIRNVCLRSDELLLRKGDRFYLRDKSYGKKKTITAEPVIEPLVSQPVAEQVIPESVPSVPAKIPLQADIFADMGDFTKRQVEKYYPKKAAQS